jgi:hypothetical protein
LSSCETKLLTLCFKNVIPKRYWLPESEAKLSYLKLKEKQQHLKLTTNIFVEERFIIRAWKGNPSVLKSKILTNNSKHQTYFHQTKNKTKTKNTIKTNLQIYIYTGRLMVETRDNRFIFVESIIFLDNDYRINNGEEESEASTNTKYINRGKKIHESRSRLT